MNRITTTPDFKLNINGHKLELNPDMERITEIDVSAISKEDKRAIGHTFFEAVKNFYTDPANEARFQEWQKARANK